MPHLYTVADFARYDGLLKVMVSGSDNSQTFILHQTTARQESRFFDHAMNTDIRDDEIAFVHIAGHSPESFQIFLNFVYGRAVYSAADDDAVSRNSGKVLGIVQNDEEWDRLAHAWVLGAYLEATDFQDAVVDAITAKVAKSGPFAPQTMHQIIYPNSAPGSTIRRLLVHIAASHWPASHVRHLWKRSDWSVFFFDLSCELLHKTSKATRKHGSRVLSALSKSRCAYHDHDPVDADSCYKKKLRLMQKS